MTIIKVTHTEKWTPKYPEGTKVRLVKPSEYDEGDWLPTGTIGVIETYTYQLYVIKWKGRRLPIETAEDEFEVIQ